MRESHAKCVRCGSSDGYLFQNTMVFYHGLNVSKHGQEKGLKRLSLAAMDLPKLPYWFAFVLYRQLH